jgi:hypothetical protein
MMRPEAVVVIPSLNGGWIEIGRQPLAARLEHWRRKHGYDPAADVGRPIQTADLVSVVSIHARERQFFTLVAWDYDAQRKFVHFLAAIPRMTMVFPRETSFRDTTRRLALDAEVYRGICGGRREVFARFQVRARSAFDGSSFETELVLRQGTLETVASACCAVFPGLGAADLYAAQN